MWKPLASLVFLGSVVILSSTVQAQQTCERPSALAGRKRLCDHLSGFAGDLQPRTADVEGRGF